MLTTWMRERDLEMAEDTTRVDYLTTSVSTTYKLRVAHMIVYVVVESTSVVGTRPWILVIEVAE